MKRGTSCVISVHAAWQHISVNLTCSLLPSLPPPPHPTPKYRNLKLVFTHLVKKFPAFLEPKLDYRLHRSSSVGPILHHWSPY